MRDPFAHVTRSDLELAIYEANLGDKATFVARKRYIDKLGQIEICGEFEDTFGFAVDRATLSRWLKCAEQLVKSALARLPQNRT